MGDCQEIAAGQEASRVFWYSSGLVYKHVLTSFRCPPQPIPWEYLLYSFLSYLPFPNDFSVQRPSFILVHCLEKAAPSLLGPLSSTVIQITYLKIMFLLLKCTSPKARQKKTVYILLSSSLPKGMHPFSAVKWVWQLLYVHVRVPVWSSIIVLQPCLWLSSTHQKIPVLWSQDSLPRLHK